MLIVLKKISKKWQGMVLYPVLWKFCCERFMVNDPETLVLPVSADRECQGLTLGFGGFL